MWTRTHSTIVRGLTPAQIWKVWTDVNQWHTWQPDIDHARMDGAFAVGNTFELKPKGAPKVTIEIVKADTNRQFTDLTRFPGARMYGDHQFVERGDEIEIVTTMTIEGPLAFLWRKIVAEDVANGMPAQTDQLIQKAAGG